MAEDTTRPYTAKGFTFPSNRHSHYPLATGQRYPARAGAITPPSQVIKSCPGDVSLLLREEEMGETESRNTQIAKKRLEVSMQLFLRSPRKRKTGKIPALALSYKQH